jgi:hypothetical protein
MKVRNLKRKPPVSWDRHIDHIIKIIDEGNLKMSKALYDVYSKLKEKNSA